MGLPGGRRFLLVIGDLLAEPVDAIVNAANGRLAHGGGVAAAIADAAGDELTADGDRSIQELGEIPIGKARVTVAGKLPYKGVIHAVGPRMGQGQEEDRVAAAVASSLECASERGWSSVAFPAISSGIFMVPLPVCARGYLRGVKEFFARHPASPVQTVRLCVFQGPIVDEVARLMEP